MEFEKLLCRIGASEAERQDIGTNTGTNTDTSTEHVSDEDRLSTDWFEVNERVHGMLDVVKNSIGNDRRWDRFKRYFNMFELVSSTAFDIPGLAAYTPTSRSFFKLTELLLDHDADIVRPYASKSAFLCDAPGGFVEAFIMHRRRRTLVRKPHDWIGKDVMHAISLVGDGSDRGYGGDGTPGWRLPRDLMRNNNIHLHGGDGDGDGDLYILENIDSFVKRVSPCSCDLVTADGGFDFSGDFNSQERSSLRLLVSEVYTALLLQADMGCLVIKMYDLRLPATLRLLWLLHTCYPGGVVIDKPASSRAANSEKFIVCKKFMRSDTVVKVTNCLRHSVSRGIGEVPLIDGTEELPPSWFLRDVAMFNTRYIAAQTKTIVRTLSHMRSGDIHGVGPVPYPCFKAQAAAAKEWCLRYNVPTSRVAEEMFRDHSSVNGMWLPSAAGSHPLKVPVAVHPPRAVLGPDPKISEEGVGTSVIQMPFNSMSRSPSATPYKDGLLLPGRKLVGANCVRLPGGGPAEARFIAIR